MLEIEQIAVAIGRDGHRVGVVGAGVIEGAEALLTLEMLATGGGRVADGSQAAAHHAGAAATERRA